MLANSSQLNHHQPQCTCGHKGMLMRQIPSESHFVRGLVNNLIAEIVLGALS